MTFSARLMEESAYANKVISRFLPEETGMQKEIFEAVNYSMLAGGKRLRPIMMKAAYDFFSGTEKTIDYFMAAVEMIHTSSLIHDDLPCMDNDEYRRGKKTTWVVYGYDMAVLAGDALLTFAFETASKALEVSKNPASVLKALNNLAHKTGIYGMIGGQTVDVKMTGKAIGERELDFIFRLKTGALIQSSMMIGAILAGADDYKVKLIEDASLKCGLAFQIRDDILDVTGTTKSLGKPQGSDDKNNKTTAVTIYGMEKAESLVKKYSEDAVNILRKLGSENSFLEQLICSLVNRTS